MSFVSLCVVIRINSLVDVNALREVGHVAA